MTMLKVGWAWFVSKLWIVTLGLAVLAITLWFRGNAWQQTADRWRLAFDAQRASYVAAQAAAEARIIAAKAATERQYADLARKADHETFADARRGIADRFASGRRMPAEAAACIASYASGTTQDRPPKDRNGPGEDAVLLSRAEYDEFVENTLRLDHVRRWGEGLIKAGLAVPLSPDNTVATALPMDAKSLD